MIPAQREFVNTIKYKYPDQHVVGAAADIAGSTIKQEYLDLLPAPDFVYANCNMPQVEKQSPISHVFLALRAYIDNQTLRCPAVIYDACK